MAAGNRRSPLYTDTCIHQGCLRAGALQLAVFSEFLALRGFAASRQNQSFLMSPPL